MRHRRRHGWHRVVNLTNVGVVVTVLFVILPLYWMVSSSFKGPSAIGSASLVPKSVSTVNYSAAFGARDDFQHYILNSVIVSVLSTALVLVLATCAGYALGRLPMRGKLPILMTLLMISVFP